MVFVFLTELRSIFILLTAPPAPLAPLPAAYGASAANGGYRAAADESLPMQPARQQHNQPMSFIPESVPVQADQIKPTPQNFQQQNLQPQNFQQQNSQPQNFQQQSNAQSQDAQSQNVQSQNAESQNPEQSQQQTSLLEVDAPKTTPAEDAKAQSSTQSESQSTNVQQQAPVVNILFNSQIITPKSELNPFKNISSDNFHPN